jgi:putative inorganic carbon (hco3(-)) transporter
MRDYIVLAIVFLSAPLAVLNSYYGILVWSWLAYFNPHRYCWGVARDFPVAIVIAIPTLIGLIFAPKNHRIFVRETILLASLWGWFALTTYYITTLPQFAGHVNDAILHLESVSKILLMTFVTIAVVASRQKLRLLVLVVIASFGLRALFAAIFFVKTGGQYKIWGPEGTFLEDNNDFALALNMTIPMFYFMARAEPAKWMRVTLRILMMCVVIAVIGTYSRGGLVGLSVIVLALLAKSRQKIIGFVLVGICIFVVALFTTSEWKDRMDSFAHGNLDSSAESRLTVWRGGWNLVRDYPVTGGGFDAYTDGPFFTQYLDGADRDLYGNHGPHSIYLQVLGEQGFVGLGLFLILLFSCLASLRQLRRRSVRDSRLQWAVPYTDMFEVSILAYMVNGATLGRAYFDLFYQIMACIIVLRILWLREVSVLFQPPIAVSEKLEVVAV